MPVGPLVVPNVAVDPWPLYAVTGKASAGMNIGHCVASTDGIAWAKVTTAQATGIKGIVIADQTNPAIAAPSGLVATNDIIVVLMAGMAVGISDATVALNDALEGGATVGQLRTYVVGADTPLAASNKIVGKALSVGGAAARFLVALKWG